MEQPKQNPRVLPTYRQSKAARQLIDWTQADLAKASGINRATIERFERGEVTPQRRTLETIADAFERQGIVFTNGKHPTVSLIPERAVTEH